MAFFDAVRIEQDPILDYDDPIGRYFDNLEYLNMVTPHPRQADWGASVYFDPQKYPDDFALERVRSFYARNHRGRDFVFKELLVSTLRQASPFLTKTAEQGFIHRGFYSDIEAADYARGVGDEVLVQSRLMQSACGHQLAKLAAFYQGEDDVKIVWQTTLGHLMGEFVVPVPLVAEDGVYWPRRKFPRPTTIHFAHTSKADAALSDGVDDSFEFTRATSEEIAFQVRFEGTHAATLFNGASREALFLWQMQVLAILRKVTWSALLPSNGKFRNFVEKHKRQRRALFRRVTRRRRPQVLPVDAVEFNNSRVQAVSEMKDKYIHDMADCTLGDYGVGLRGSDCDHTVGSFEVLIAAIHGSTYCPWGDPENEHERHDPLNTLFPVASWLGRLKRHRYLRLDVDMARMILSVAAIVEDDETTWGCRSYKPLLRERFGDRAWDKIVETAHEVETEGRAIPIRYDWTRDPLQERSVERRPGGLLLVGPLLDFPLRDAAIWNHRALELPARLNLPGWN